MSRSQVVAIAGLCAGAVLVDPRCAKADVLSEGPLSGPYVGAAAGRFDLKLDDFDDVGTAVHDITHSTHDSYRVDVGWRFAPFFALEADYVNFGDSHDSFVGSGSDGDYRLHLSGFAPFVVGTLPLGPIEVFAKGGYLFYNTNLTVDFHAPPDDVLQSSHSRSDFIYGGGLGLTLIGHLNLNAEYDRIRIVNARDSDALWLGAAWRF